MLEKAYAKALVAITIFVALGAYAYGSYQPETMWSLILDGAVQNLVWVVVGVVLLEWIQEGILEYRYGRWKVIICHPSEKIPPDDVTAAKAKDVLNEPSEKRVWIKGLMSTYVIVKTDCTGEAAREAELFKQDNRNRRFIIDLNNLTSKDGKVTLAIWQNGQGILPR